MSFLSYSRAQLRKTIITGIPQIVQVKGALRKIIKSIVFFGCIAGCMYQIWSFLEVYWTYPVVVQVFVANPYEISAPAFSFCPLNGLDPKTFCDDYPTLCAFGEEYEEFCSEKFTLCATNYTVPKKPAPAITPYMLPTIPDILPKRVRLVYAGRYSAHLQMFTTKKAVRVSADGDEDLKAQKYGVFSPQLLPINCYAYNGLWGKPNSTLPKADVQTEYKFKFQSSTKDAFYSIIPNSIQVAVHPPGKRIDPFRYGFSVKACKKYNMYISKNEKHLLPAPYTTNCTDYRKAWLKRGGKGPLDQMTCIEECLLNRSISAHGCFDPSYITIPNGQPFCFGEDKRPPLSDYFECRSYCPPACFYESLDVYHEEFTAEEVDTSDVPCATEITFYMTRLELRTYTYKQKYENVELFGYVGGYLGMWLGFSLIAAADFLETLLTIACYACRRPKKPKKQHVRFFYPYEASKIMHM